MKKLFFVIPLVFLGILLYRRLHIKKSPFSFETDKITLVYYDDHAPNWQGELTEMEITNPQMIETIVQMCSNHSFDLLADYNMTETLCSMWLNFHNGTVIGLADGLDCGTIGNEISEVSASLQLPHGFYEYISILAARTQNGAIRKIS